MTTLHHHGPNISEQQSCRTCIAVRIAPQLDLHAGRGPWGTNDGSLRSTLIEWGLHPEDFIESLNSWGYEIVVRKP